MRTLYSIIDYIRLKCILMVVCRLDGKHVVFGKIIGGMKIIKQMEALGSQSGKTKADVVISDCGELD